MSQKTNQPEGQTLPIELKFADRERLQISGELHDNVASKLSLIRYKLYHQPSAVKEVINMLDNVMFSVRALSHGLNSTFTERLDFIDIIRDHILPLHGILDTRLYYWPRNATPIGKQQKLHLSRIFQEVLNNLLKHSKATIIWIHLRHSKEKLIISVEDNGIGFNPKALTEGLGLKNIRYRAQRLHAKLKYKQTKSGGTLFIIAVPLENRKE